MRIIPPDAALRLAAIVESSDDAIVSKDLTGIITSWNSGAEQLFGYTADEAVGQSITMLIPPDRLSEEDVVLTRIRAGQRVDHFETVRWRKDGTLVDVSVTVSPIRDATGAIVGASKIARNISDRKRIEAQVHDLQHRLMGLAVASASILDSPNVDAVLSAAIGLARDVFAADAYALWRTDARGLWKVARSFGLSGEFTARAIAPGAGEPGAHRVPFSEPLICDDVQTAPMIADMRDAYLREGITSMIVFPLLVRGERSGTMVFYSRRRREFRDVDVQVGTALANLAAAALTTAELYEEQRTAREAADHARRQARFLAEAGTVLSASLDDEATLKAVAELSVPALADWCAVDIVGDRGVLRRLAIAHVDPGKVELVWILRDRYEADPNAPGGVHEVIRTGKPAFTARIPAEVLEAARDDEHRRIIKELSPTSYMCVPMIAQGRAFGAITFVSAESGREYNDGDLRFARELASRASLAVENARSYARASEASRLKDEFLATLSHELRTPLNAVLGYARMLRVGTIAADRTKSALDVIERNATALKKIIEDVLDVSRIVAGRLRLNVEPVDLPAIIHESCATVMPAADAKGVRVEAIVDPLTTPVSGDAGRLQQIVWNLLSNAIKFTPRGGKVQLRLSRVNSHVEITVSDTGRGIAPDFLPYVFERFRQGDATFARDQGGLGLGLAIAKQLTELHGGTVSASSEGSGKGATFTVTLPLMVFQRGAVAEPLREQPRTDRPAPSLEIVPRLDGVHVLAVDDEPDSLNLLRSVLEGVGATVTAAESAMAALDLIRQRPPDVMVADIGMPGMDGLQLIRAIRQMDEPVRSMPAASLTAYARSQDRITSLASGFQMHLVKPIDPLELIVAVSTLAPRRLTA
jgi:PAS domain S-box-containing protein